MKEVKTLSRIKFKGHFNLYDRKVLALRSDFEKLVFKRSQIYREITVDELEEISKKLIEYSNYSNMLKEQYKSIGGITEKDILKHAMIELLQNCCIVTFVD